MVEQMKPSGIDWIKEIPVSWNINKVKYLATDSNTLFLDGDWIESDVIEDSGIRYLTTGNVGAGYYKDQGSGYISQKTFDELHCLKVFPGDLMISRLNEPIARACIVPEGEDFYVVAVDNVILRPNKGYNKKFIMYAMNTDGYAEHGNIIARGATMSRVSRSQLGQFWIAYPAIKEQNAIANYLDFQCSKLDSIISDLEKQIETLQKYKKSLILETVTKGLNKNAPMKSSGIDWIGDIPAHWKVSRLKYHVNCLDGKRIPIDAALRESGDYPYWGAGSIVDYVNDYIFDEEIVLLGEDGAPFFDDYRPVSFLVKEKVWVNNHIHVLKGINGVLNNYLVYFLNSVKYDIYINGSILNKLTQSNMNEIALVVPSELEQKSIKRDLTKRSFVLCTLIRGCVVLRQYKHSLA